MLFVIIQKKDFLGHEKKEEVRGQDINQWLYSIKALKELGSLKRKKRKARAIYCCG